MASPHQGIPNDQRWRLFLPQQQEQRSPFELKDEKRMTVNPNGMSNEQLLHLRVEIAKAYGIELYRQYSEKVSASLILPPDERPTGLVDASTIKRKRRSNKIPYVACGDGSIAYLGVMLCDFIIFGEASMLLWGSN
ncbi:hypothetical protein [Methylobacterium sp. A54F]